MILRRARLVVTLLLVLSAFIATTAPTNLITPVQGVAPSLSLNPTRGPYGLEVQFSGSGFSRSDTTCTVAPNPAPNTIVTKPACVVNLVSTTRTGVYATLYGSFTVGNRTVGEYVIRVTGSSGDFAEAVFWVTFPPRLTLSNATAYGSDFRPLSGRIGAHVSFNGSRFYGGDTSCLVSSPGSGLVTFGACIVTATGNGTYANVTGSFTVGNVNPGQYIVQVTGALCLGSLACDFAQAIFNVTLGPTITLIASPGPGVTHGVPESGPAGTHVNVYGTGFLPVDTTCTITGPGSGIVTAAACIKVKGSTTVNGSFTVGNVVPGQYLVQVTGNGGDFAQAIFNVTLGPSITLTPSTGPVGIHVSVSGVGFLPTDTTCSITSPGSGLVTAAACVKQSGSTTITASFTVGNVLPGQYVVQVTGSAGNDFAQAIFNVTRGPIIQLAVSPVPPNTFTPVGQITSGPVGIHVNIEGTYFLPTDTSCSISSPTSSSFITAAACSPFIPSSGPFTGFGNVTGSFTVGNVLPGQYVVRVTGSGGDFAQAIFNVTLGPTITLTPSSGVIGDHISVTGSGFLPTDVSCTIVSGSSNLYNPILSGSQACVKRAGSTTVTGSFYVANVPPGQYVIQVNGNQGDSAQAILTVSSGVSTLILYPTNATNGATVTFRGTGFSVSDTGCVVQSAVENVALGVYVPNTKLITSSTCSIVSPQVAQGSFVVGPYATTNINWTVQVKGTPVNDIPAMAVFNVTASIVVTPTSGTRNTVFTFTGSGFSSTATSCQAHIYPPFPAVPPTLPPACYLSTNLGQVSGSVIAPGSVISGTYAINVGDNRGHNATGVFTIGTPSALIVLNPATVAQGQPVGVVGMGFNPNDTYCVITTAGGNSLWDPANGGSLPVCQISGGYASGAFTVADNAVGGYYLITLTAWGDYHKNNVTGGDFASNFLGVNLASTVTTYSTTTTTSSTTTQMSTTTTSVATSYSYSSTTYSTTGILITTYSHLTVNTVSGPTTTTASATTSTSQTLTTVTVTTTTVFTTVSCGPLPCGYAVGSTVGSQSINPGPLSDNIGLLAVLLLIVPMLLRKLFS